MKITIPDPLILIDIIVATLGFSIFVFHSVILQFVFGIPFIVLFPGYVVVRLLFSGKRIETLEYLALSSGISVALIGLVGFILNLTVWGITAKSVIFTVGTLIIILSLIVLAKSVMLRSWAGLTFELRYKGRLSNGLNTTSSILIVLIIFAVGLLGYAVLQNNNSEKFTELYILGKDNKADNYPSVFLLQDSKVAGVIYGSGPEIIQQTLGKVIVRVINHEGKTFSYGLKTTVDGDPIDVFYNNQLVSEPSFILSPGDVWQAQIGFTPLHLGLNQKVEFTLFDSTTKLAIDTVQIYIDVQ